MHTRIYHRRPFRPLLERIREQQFFAAREWLGLHLGVFDSFDAARSYCEKHGVEARYSLDHEWWSTVQSRLHLHDYPVLYWLSGAIGDRATIADLGGSVGVSYYAFKPYLNPRSDVAWLVCELPDVVAQGQELARQRGAHALRFTSSFEDIDAHDILLAAGVLQFIEPSLSELLATLQHPPRYLLINRIPVHESNACVTLQNTGSSIAPCHIFCRQQLLNQLLDAGYALLDEWSCPATSLHIPFHPEYHVPAFSGFCFRRRADTGFEFSLRGRGRSHNH